MRLRGLLAAFLALPCIGMGQGLMEAKITGQPLVYLKNGVVEGCGVRLFSVLIDQNLTTGYGWDGSFNFWVNGLASVKGLAYDLDVEDVLLGKKPKTAPIDRLWIKAPNLPATQPRDNKIFPGEDKDSIIYVIELESALDLLEATLLEETLTVGVKRRGETGERLYFGVPQLTEAERQQLTNCLKEAVQNR